MQDIPMISLWQGTPLTELTREELIVAVEELGRLYTKSLEDQGKILETFSAARKHRA